MSLYNALFILCLLFGISPAHADKRSQYDMDVAPSGGVLTNDLRLRLEGREYDKPFMGDIERLVREVIDDAKMPSNINKKDFSVEHKTLTFVLHIDSNIAVAPVKAVIEIERISDALPDKQTGVLYYNPDATDAFKEGLRAYLKKYLNAVFPTEKNK
ncbi:MAG: hypothetical protein RIT27_1865 [Pseudomonadota bacterium]|jgi:hypothetical protein